MALIDKAARQRFIRFFRAGALRLSSIWSKLLLTGRGLILAGLGFFALRAIALPESDLFLSMLAGAALGLPLLLAACTLFSAARLKRRLQIEARFDRQLPIAGRPIKSAFILRESNFLPLYELTLEREFRHPGAESPLHIIRGAESYERLRHLFDTVRFPHRGVWRLTGARATLRDRFGLTHRSFHIPLEEEIEVCAPIQPIRPLPIVASSARAGDLLQHTRERTGDLFDLKSYDPSDGISRILWKTFAKSGQLVVRRPEPSLIPEGEVAIFVVAREEDDHVAGAFASYLGQLIGNQITPLFGTDGGGDKILTLDGEIFRALHEAVWDSRAGTAIDLAGFLDRIIASGRMLTQVVVFVPDVEGPWYRRVIDATSARGIRLSLAVVPEEFIFTPHRDKVPKRVSTLLGQLKVRKDVPKRISSRHFPHNTGEILLCERSEYLQ